MSSILRALKKLENHTTASPGIPIGPGTGGSGLRQSKSPLLLKILFVLILISGGAAGGIFLYSKPAHKTSSIPASVAKNTIVSADTGMKNNVLQKPAVHDSSGIKPDTLMKADNNPGIQIPSETNQPEQAGVEEEGALNHTETPAVHKDIQEATTTDAPEPEVEAPANPPEPKVQEPSKWERVPEIDESSGLELQAISWGRDPKKRLAVISGQLCHENDSVNGYVVKQINPDDVILSNGSVTGKLVLKIR